MEAATLTRSAAGCRADATDEDLVGAVRAGDERAFEALYARYQRRIGAYVLGMVKDHQRAEDVTQEVFLSALRRMRQTERPIAFKPWIYEIAKNACIDQFRRAKRGQEVSYDAEDGGGVGPLVCGGPTPDAAVHAREELDHLRGAFVGLNESHHRILVMRELEGRSYAEIGARMGMTRPAVESTLFRARKRLGEEYEELISGERCRRVQSIIANAEAGSLGARDQRRMARHVSYCQPCRRAAALAGLGELVPARTGVRAKIAGLLPLPVILRDRWLGIGSPHGAAAGDGGGAGTSAFAGWLHAAAPVIDAGGGGWMKAMATAATVAVAGVGAGAVVGDRGAAAGGGGHGAPAPARAAAGGGAARVAAKPAAPALSPSGAATSRAGAGARAATRIGVGGVAPGGSARPSSSSRTAAGSAGPGTTSAPSGGGTSAPSGAGSVPDPTGTVTGVAADPGSAATAVSQQADQGRQAADRQLPPVSPPSTPEPPPTPAVGDTQIKVPAPPDVTKAADQAVQQATGAVNGLTNGLQGTVQAVGNALAGRG